MLSDQQDSPFPGKDRSQEIRLVRHTGMSREHRESCVSTPIRTYRLARVRMQAHGAGTPGRIYLLQVRLYLDYGS